MQRLRLNRIRSGALVLLALHGCGTYQKIGVKSSEHSDRTESIASEAQPDPNGEASAATIDSSKSSAATLNGESSVVDVVAASITEVSTPTPTPSATVSLKPCAPKGAAPVGFRFVFDQVKGGQLVIEADDTSNTLTVSGGGGPGVIRIIGINALDVTVVPCVTSVTLNGNGGDDTLRVGDGFPGITSINVVGGAGNNTISLFGTITSNVTIN